MNWLMTMVRNSLRSNAAVARILAGVWTVLAFAEDLRGQYASAVVFALFAVTAALVAVSHAVEDRP